jgi:membrane-associated phospholipid phosphatase
VPKTAEDAAAPSPGSGPGALVARYRPAIATVYVALVLVVLFATDRFDRPTVLVCVLGGAVVLGWRNPRPWARFVMDWMPLFVVLVSYDLVRAQADSLIPRAHLDPQLAIDKFIGGGKAPTVRLQDAYLRPNHLHWYDYAAFVVYLSHFVAVLVVGVVLYRVNRERFRRFAKVFLVFSLAGYATYVLYPAIPPWLAGRQGALPGATRAVHTIWQHLDLEFMERVFSGNPRYSNPVGALPSEHAAYPLLFLLLFWAIASRGWRIVLVSYTFVMAIALVYLGEHYVTDVVVGWIYAIIAVLVVSRVLDRRAARRPTELRASSMQPVGSS